MDYHFQASHARGRYVSNRREQRGRLNDRVRSLCERACVQNVYD